MWSYVSVYPFYRPLQTAVKHRQVSAVTWLLLQNADPNGGVDVNSLDAHQTPLKACLQFCSRDLPSQDIKRGNERELARYQIFRALLERGANPNLAKLKGDSLLREAYRQVYKGLGVGRGIPYLALLLKHEADSSRLCIFTDIPHDCYLRRSRLGLRVEHHDELWCSEGSLFLDPMELDIIIQEMEDCQINRDLLSADEFQRVRNFFITVRHLRKAWETYLPLLFRTV